MRKNNGNIRIQANLNRFFSESGNPDLLTKNGNWINVMNEDSEWAGRAKGVDKCPEQLSVMPRLCPKEDAR
jgi:hypothetical protein